MARPQAITIQEDESSSQTPSPNSSSDKENRHAGTRPGDTRKRSQPGMASHAHMSTPNRGPPNKRQRLGERSSNTIIGSQTQSSQSRNKYYDPDQDATERRQVRKGFRDLTRDLHDSRSEYLQAGNHGIRHTVEKANDYFENVKQTADATLDSRLLVNAADLSYKKTVQLALGDATAGIDVDEFVSKCITYMHRGPHDPTALPSSTQARTGRAPRRSQVDPEDSDEDQGDALNWDWLGRTACFRHNARPPVSGFLLGPLSVQKRVRQQTQRRAKERIDPTQTVQPQELRNEDLGKQETSDLTSMCVSINKLLSKTQTQSQNMVDEQLSKMDESALTDEIVHEVMDKHDVADDGGVPFFRFCINPKSFGQTVENLFYVSFLVRDGTVGMEVDSRGLPTLHGAKPYAPSEAQRKGIQKHQAVFSLDFDTWKDLIEVYGITKSIIPHRPEEQHHDSRQGWYG